MYSFGARLKSSRKIAKMTQTELALRMGVAQETICRYENNKQRPTYDNLRMLANQLNVTIDYLTEGT